MPSGAGGGVHNNLWSLDALAQGASRPGLSGTPSPASPARPQCQVPLLPPSRGRLNPSGHTPCLLEADPRNPGVCQ